MNVFMYYYLKEKKWSFVVLTGEYTHRLTTITKSIDFLPSKITFSETVDYHLFDVQSFSGECDLICTVSIVGYKLRDFALRSVVTRILHCTL